LRRTRLAAALVGVLTLGAAATSVATAAAKHPAAIKPTCALALTQQIPAGETAINQADTSGTKVGTVTCGKLLGTGLAEMAFTIPDSGNLVGTTKQYFALGSMHGSYVLVPDQTDSNSFTASSYTGTLIIKGGTGAYQLAKGTGTLKCTSSDSVHLNCVEHLKLSRL
jgi:hypothetical protein